MKTLNQLAAEASFKFFKVIALPDNKVNFNIESKGLEQSKMAIKEVKLFKQMIAAERKSAQITLKMMRAEFTNEKANWTPTSLSGGIFGNGFANGIARALKASSTSSKQRARAEFSNKILPIETVIAEYTKFELSCDQIINMCERQLAG